MFYYVLLCCGVFYKILLCSVRVLWSIPLHGAVGRVDETVQAETQDLQRVQSLDEQISVQHTLQREKERERGALEADRESRRECV